MSTVLLSVGDVSGDFAASDFVRALRALRPGIRFLGMGGDRMEKEGVELVVHQREVATGGFVELLPELPRIVGAWRKMSNALRTARPDLVVLVDSSGFNLPFARVAARQGAPVLYYVAPQVWAWRRARIAKLARRVARIAVILPFEPEVYAGHPVRVDYVGHPLVDSIAMSRLSRNEARESLGLPLEAQVVALLPGSRRGELHYQLSLYLEVASRLHQRNRGLRFVLPVAPSLELGAVERGIEAAGLAGDFPLNVLAGRAREVLSAADVALAKPGTSTLEAALLDCPLVVAARTHPLTAALVRRLVTLDSLTLPNLIAGAAVVPEFLQEDATAEPVAAALESLLSGPPREKQREDLAAVARALGAGGAAQRAAGIAEGMLVARLAA